MRNFRKSLAAALSVLLCFAALSAAVIAPYYIDGRYSYQDAQVRKDLAGQFDTLVSGASQGLRAIDPRVLDKELGCSSYVLGAPLQTMYGRYLFLERELERNPVKTVFIELSYDAVARAYEEHGNEGSIYQLGRSDSLVQWLDYFFHQVPPKDWVGLLYDAMTRGVTSWKRMLWEGPYTPEQYETHGFLTGLESVPMPSEELYGQDYHKEQLPTAPQEENLEYLDKCIELCRDKGIEVVLITTPVSEYMLWSNDGFDDILQVHREISEKWDVPLLDFNLKRDKLDRYPEETSYCDQHHLCEESAREFSKDLAETVKLLRAGEDTGALFYGSYEEAIRGRSGR